MKKSPDPTPLLARGLTARYLGTNISHKFKALSSDEVEKDLRHIQAYYDAVISYRQQLYISYNNVTPAVVSTVQPPIKLDPEEDKRLQHLQKKIAKAEAKREEWEQQYVALRAHYVQEAQDLQSAERVRTTALEFLRDQVSQKTHTLGSLRARLQMCRDILECLKARGSVLGDESNSTASNLAAQPDLNDPLIRLWDEAEEEPKSSITQNDIPWECIREPSTPYGVPLLLSAISSVPEKSIASSAGGFLGSKKDSLVWIESHLEGVEDTDVIERNAELREEVDFLERELARERQESQEYCHKIAVHRSRSDRYISMIAIVRQETEALLHRYNVILDSDEAQAAAAKIHEAEQAEKENDEGAEVPPKTVTTLQSSEGDEGSLGDEDNNWGNGNKREADQAFQGAAAGRKRRKV